MSKPIPLPPEYLEKKFKKSLKELEEYKHIGNMNELIDLLINFRHNKKLITLSNFGEDKYFRYMKKANVNFIKIAKKELAGLISFNAGEMSFISFTSIYSVIIFNLMSEFNRELNKEEIGCVLHSNLIPKLIFAQDNFLSVEDEYVDNDYFKQLKKIKFTKEIRKFDKIIYGGYWSCIYKEILLDGFKCADMGICSKFLSGCYAFADGRYEVIPEDIINGWILTLKLFDIDLRPYI